MNLVEAQRFLPTDLTTGAVSLEPIGGGGNSRVYKLTDGAGSVCAVKVYFKDLSGARDRLRVEFSSLSWLWQNGVRDIPRPIRADYEKGCAVYEYIEGPRALAQSVTEADIDAMVLFLRELKELSGRPDSRGLPDAAEACFSVHGIAENIERRLARLTADRIDDSLHAELYRLLDEEFSPLLQEIVGWSRERLAAAGSAFDGEIEITRRTLSPSDFGVHNATRRDDGRLVFVDFEYFGWDDPAKMIADVLLHPAMVLSPNLKNKFVADTLNVFADHPDLADRLKTVYPLFGLKWCMILANEFLPADLARRRFAGGGKLNGQAAQLKQLQKIKQMLKRISEEYERFPHYK